MNLKKSRINYAKYLRRNFKELDFVSSLRLAKEFSKHGDYNLRKLGFEVGDIPNERIDSADYGDDFISLVSGFGGQIPLQSIISFYNKCNQKFRKDPSYD